MWVLEYGIWNRTILLFENLLEDIKETPFNFKFDETTTNQVKK